MQKNKKEKIAIFITIILMVAAIVVTASAGKKASSIVGYAPIGPTIQKTQIYATEPTTYTITTNNNNRIKAIKISGRVIGNGRAQIMLTADKEYEIYSNQKRKVGNLITGMAVRLQELEEETTFTLQKETSHSTPNPNGDWSGYEEKFNQICKKTCDMNLPIKNTDKYYLEIRLDPNTKIEIDNIIYKLS